MKHAELNQTVLLGGNVASKYMEMVGKAQSPPTKEA